MERQLSLAAKLLLIGAGGLAILAGPVLFLFPTQTEAYFAWTIKHPLTPVFMGANYLGGLGALWTVRMDRWSVARVQIPGIFVFAITQLVATLLHLPIFNWSHPVAWAWLFVYVSSPVAAFLVYRSMERGYVRSATIGVPVPPVVSSIFRVFALLNLAIGLGLILWPFFAVPGSGSAVPWWAWTLTPLTARVAGGWYLAAATLHHSLSRQRSLDTMRPSLLGLLIVTGLQLLGAWIWRESFDGWPALIVLYLLSSVVVFVLSAFSLLRSPSPLKSAV